jgi:hypothetical protein
MGEINAYNILVENLKGRYHLENLCVFGKITLECLKEVVWEGVEWMQLVLDRDQW